MDAGDDALLDNPPPRAWLLGTIFARRFISSLVAEGGTGKTALRYAQYLSLATGRELTGERVFQRCRVLIVSLEDNADELRRRVRAAMLLHYWIDRAELRGWLFLAAPGAHAGKLMALNSKGRPEPGRMAAVLKNSHQRISARSRRPRPVRQDAFGFGKRQRRDRRYRADPRRPGDCARHRRGHPAPRPQGAGRARRRRSQPRRRCDRAMPSG